MKNLIFTLLIAFAVSSCSVFSPALSLNFKKTETGDFVMWIFKNKSQKVLKQNGIDWQPQEGRYAGTVKNEDFRKLFGSYVVDKVFTQQGFITFQTQKMKVQIIYEPSKKEGSTDIVIHQSFF